MYTDPFNMSEAPLILISPEPDIFPSTYSVDNLSIFIEPLPVTVISISSVLIAVLAIISPDPETDKSSISATVI